MEPQKKGNIVEGDKAEDRNVNKFTVLIDDNYEESSELRTLKDIILVDQFLNKKLQPTCSEVSNWSKDMINYFKDQWEIDRLKEQDDHRKNMEDVYENEERIAQTMTADNVRVLYMLQIEEWKDLWKGIIRAKRLSWMALDDDWRFQCYIKD
nr:zinc knuckle CX2CX4HX4C [Tanacetum cinerariifolium]